MNPPWYAVFVCSAIIPASFGCGTCHGDSRKEGQHENGCIEQPEKGR
jgi:hypothetical protein